VKTSYRSYWNLLVAYLKPQWPRVSLLAALILGNIGLRLVNPQIVRFFIDTAVTGGAIAHLFRAALAFFGIAIVVQLVSIATTYVSENVAWTATNTLRYDLTLHCLKLDASFHKAHTSGELIERIDGDVNTLANFFSRFVIDLLGNTLLVVGVLALLYREDWRVGGGLTLFSAVAMYLMIRLRAIATPYWTLVRKQMAEFYGFLGERLAGTEDVRANGAQGYVMRRFYELTRERLPAQMRAGMAGYAMWMINETLFAVGIALAFALGAYLWDAGTMTIGTVYLVVHYTELLRSPLAHIRGQITDLQRAAAGVGRVRELFHVASKLGEGADGLTLPPGALPVSFRDVSFGYEKGEPVLQEVTFALSPGRVLGLLGRTGSGKTTLARLLLRLYDPNGGEIQLGGVAPGAVRLSEVRRRVGMVTQEVQLFQATVREPSATT
jgi:ABC-type multidrug transport system fused ATPase/permease subunit